MSIVKPQTGNSQKKRLKVCASQRPQEGGAYPSFLSMKHDYRSLAIPRSPLDGMLVHRRVTPWHYFVGIHLYTWVKRDKVV